MKTLKQKIRDGETVLGSWITLGHTAIAEIMAKAGFDWLAVDLEHSTMSLGDAGEMIRAISLAGAVPFVRLSVNDPVQVKRVMDAGAQGIIVPMVNSRADAEAAAKAMYYPPRGTRGVGLYRAQGYGATFAEYKRWLAEEAVLIVQVEHVDAVNDLDAILGVEDVDGYIIGPYDLSASMGFPGEFEREEFLEAMKTIETKGKSSGKARGIHVIEPDEDMLRQRLGEGYAFVAYSLDIRMLDSAARAGTAIAKE